MVVLRSVVVNWPPNRTIRLRVVSYTDAAQIRGEGEVAAPWADEPEGVLSAEELQAMFPPNTLSSTVAARAVELGVLVPDREAFRIPSPRLLRIGAELAALGVPLDSALDVLTALRQDTDAIAQLFVELFNRHVWEPFRAAGMPAERLPLVTDALRRLRPLASAAVGAELARAMEDAVARTAVEQVRMVRESAAAGGEVASA